MRVLVISVLFPEVTFSRFNASQKMTFFVNKILFGLILQDSSVEKDHFLMI